MEKSEALAKKQKNKKNRPKEKDLSDAYGEVTNLLSQMNFKSAYEIIPVPDHTSDGKTPEYQICQRSTESKDPVTAAASCVTSVQMSESVGLSLTALPCLHLQSTSTDSSVVPAQLTKNSGVSSSVTADLQLSNIDRKGTFFSTLPTHGYNICDPAADLTAYIKHSYPLHHSSECSGAAQSDQDHSDSADDLLLGGRMEQLQKLSLREHIFKMTSVPSKLMLPEDVMQQKPFRCFKHTEAALKLDKDYLSSSSQLNKLVRDTKKVLPETCASESSAPVSQEGDTLHEMMQKDRNISCSTSLVPSGQTREVLHTVCEVLPQPQKPANVVSVFNVTKTCTQTAWKTSIKSVCQGKCSSSEDSDDGNMNRNPVCKQKKRQLNPSQLKKTFAKKRYNTASSKSTSSDSALVIKGREKTTNFKQVCGNLSLEVFAKDSSVVEVDCSQSSEQLFQGAGSSPAQQTDSDVLISAWADSPLPLSERLKRRLKSN
ncbi:hypothetical protein CIB84_009209 [Bambusicola thoracicus]|uniref:Uncharacterized protein n=1 Tax=Bambusicola thoracicus TaxID=9083 RepID=A0A2P4SSF7_BAMTH|nr:hypothetical protein CIB84_009209 [Bambusicola thoracicus]